MKSSDIRVKHIYNVEFDPVHANEFDSKHLALVLKKNSDGRTFIVVPLTSSSNGLGTGKIFLGKISTLPSSLSSNNTYAVTNQIRTVNADRFISLKQGSLVIQSAVDDSIFEKVLKDSINQLALGADSSLKLHLFNDILCDEKMKEATSVAYLIKNGLMSEEEKNEKLKIIKELIKDVSYTLPTKCVDDGIDKIFEEAKKHEW
jgi:uncharacterized protein YifN (PemK superfamily)